MVMSWGVFRIQTNRLAKPAITGFVLSQQGQDISKAIVSPKVPRAEFDHPRVKDAYQRVIAACRANGKYAGLGGVYDLELMQRYIALGMQFILCGNDLSMLMAAARERVQQLRN